jgi:hypothetical protein
MSTVATGKGTDTRLARAVTRALDAAADTLPEILKLRDGPMLRLQGRIEDALQRALGIRTEREKPKHGAK